MESTRPLAHVNMGAPSFKKNMLKVLQLYLLLYTNGLDEQKAAVGSFSTHCVEDEDGAELNQAVQGHVSEEAEGGDQRTAALSAQTTRGNSSFLPQMLLHTLFVCFHFQHLTCSHNVNALGT